MQIARLHDVNANINYLRCPPYKFLLRHLVQSRSIFHEHRLEIFHWWQLKLLNGQLKPRLDLTSCPLLRI
uniref:Uncharacterized protein n=1 Tax=Phlebotomus papatasi TaxID=29031 RepID=A0A1B0DAH8_PHLPP